MPLVLKTKIFTMRFLITENALYANTFSIKGDFNFLKK